MNLNSASFKNLRFESLLTNDTFFPQLPSEMRRTQIQDGENEIQSSFLIKLLENFSKVGRINVTSKDCSVVLKSKTVSKRF